MLRLADGPQNTVLRYGRLPILNPATRKAVCYFFASLATASFISFR